MALLSGDLLVEEGQLLPGHKPGHGVKGIGLFFRMGGHHRNVLGTNALQGFRNAHPGVQLTDGTDEFGGCPSILLLRGGNPGGKPTAPRTGSVAVAALSAAACTAGGVGAIAYKKSKE